MEFVTRHVGFNKWVPFTHWVPSFQSVLDSLIMIRPRVPRTTSELHDLVKIYVPNQIIMLLLRLLHEFRTLPLYFFSL